MANSRHLDKNKLAIFILLLNGVALCAAASTETMNDAKRFLAEGNRKESIRILDTLGRKGKLPSSAEKRVLFAEQFLSSVSFQKYQEARGSLYTERWEDCLKSLDGADSKDQDNTLVLTLRSKCNLRLGRMDAARTALEAALEYLKSSASLTLQLADIALKQQDLVKASQLLAAAAPRTVQDTDRYHVLSAKLIEQTGSAEKAVRYLREHVDNGPSTSNSIGFIEIHYALGALLRKDPNSIEQAKAHLQTFVARCDNLGETAIKDRDLSAALYIARDWLKPEATK